MILGLLSPQISAIGYHSVQNYLYGVAWTVSLQTIIRIGAGGSAEIAWPGFQIPAAVTTQPLVIGDIDGNQQYWLGHTDGAGYVQVDLNANSATYGQVVGQGTTHNKRWNVGDWAWVPQYPNRLYALGQEITATILNVVGTYNTHLVYFDTDTKEWNEVRAFNGTTGGPLGQALWGAVYTANDGNIYATESITGETWRFPLESGAPAQVYQGIPPILPIVRYIDGARCPFNDDLTVNRRRALGG